METNNEQTSLEKDIDQIIVKILLPIIDSLELKTKEIKQKRLELKKEIYNIKQLKQSLINKRKKLKKQRIIYENTTNIFKKQKKMKISKKIKMIKNSPLIMMLLHRVIQVHMNMKMKIKILLLI